MIFNKLSQADNDNNITMKSVELKKQVFSFSLEKKIPEDSSKYIIQCPKQMY